MTYWQTYAFISKRKVVNIAVYEPNGAYTLANMQAKQMLNDSGAYAVDVTQIPVMIGDDCIDGSFYRDGVRIDPLPTEEQMVEKHEEEIDELWTVILEG